MLLYTFFYEQPTFKIDKKMRIILQTFCDINFSRAGNDMSSLKRRITQQLHISIRVSLRKSRERWENEWRFIMLR